jgi:hypothetical protein
MTLLSLGKHIDGGMGHVLSIIVVDIFFRQQEKMKRA